MVIDNNHTRYRGVCLRLWDDDKFSRASDECKLVWTHLFTNKLSNPIGCYQAYLSGLAEELNRNGRWPLKRYQAAFNECVRLGFIEHDPNAAIILFPKFFSIENKPNHPHTPNVIKKWGKFWRALPPSLLKTKCRTNLRDLILQFGEGQAWSDAFEEGFPDTIPKGILKGVPEGIRDTIARGVPQYRVQITDNRLQKTDKKKEVALAAPILKFLNEKTGKHFEVRNGDGTLTESIKFIIARMREGATEELCRAVIIRKTRDWKGDPKMDSFLRPATLFNRTKFEQYAGEVPKELPTDKRA